MEKQTHTPGWNAVGPEMLAALREMVNQSVANRAYCQGRVLFSNERVNMTSAALLMATKAIARATAEHS